MKEYPHHAYIRVRLPKFLITYLREIVKHGNELAPERTTVSEMVEWWMLKMIQGNRRASDHLADRSPQFKSEAEAWIRWVMQRSRDS